MRGWWIGPSAVVVACVVGCGDSEGDGAGGSGGAGQGAGTTVTNSTGTNAASPASSGTGASGTGGAGGGPGFAPMPLISRGVPVFSNHESAPATRAVDDDYGTKWRSGHSPSTGDPDWIAVDLSSIPSEQRQSVYALWFNEGGYNYETSDSDSYSLPGDFRWEVNTAAGGGDPPTDGWTALASHDANTLGSGADLFSLSGASWLRFVSTASAVNVADQNEDTSLQLEIYDAHLGVDGWKFTGDSITSNSMRHTAGDSFGELVDAQVGVFPPFQLGGHGGWTSSDQLDVIDDYLANFPGRYFAISYGTNDAGGDPAIYAQNMADIVDAVIAAGKIPVVPTIYYTGDPGHSNIPAFNDEIQQLYTDYGAQVLHGPDNYKILYDGRDTMFDQPTDLHPNAAGNAAIRKAWADTIAAAVY